MCIRDRFRTALGGFGVHAATGRVEGGWCPGFSDVAVDGRKLIGLGYKVTDVYKRQGRPGERAGEEERGGGSGHQGCREPSRPQAVAWGVQVPDGGGDPNGFQRAGRTDVAQGASPPGPAAAADEPGQDNSDHGAAYQGVLPVRTDRDHVHRGAGQLAEALHVRPVSYTHLSPLSRLPGAPGSGLAALRVR